MRELNQRFPATNHWFGMVADLQFNRPGGDFVPRYETLHSARVLRTDPAGGSLDVRLPASTRGWQTIAFHGDPSVWVETREQGLADVPGELDGGVVVYPHAAGGADLLYKLTPTHADEYLYVTDQRQQLRRTIDLQLGPGVSTLRGSGEAVFVLDRQGMARLRVTAPLARAADGVRRRGTIRVDGNVLVEELDLTGLARPILVDPDWSTTGTMTTGHWADASWLMAPDKVMVVGGCALTGCPATFAREACGQVLGTSEIWTESSGTWVAGPSLATPRFSFAGVELGNGDFLVAGGCTRSPCNQMTATAEVYRQADATWHAAGSFARARAHLMSALLPDGKVLMAGGCGDTACYADTDLWDPQAGAWSSGTPLAAPRGFATSTTLADGKVLVTGGCADPECQTILGDAEIYDPATGTWAAAGAMSTPRAGHTATLLADGSVLVAGGCADADCNTTLSSAEIWAGGSFTAAPSMLGARHDQTATRLATGDVLIAGGADGATATVPSAEVWIAAQHGWLPIYAMQMSRAFHVADLLGSGKVLVAGGCNPSTCMPWAELYDPAGLPGELDGGVPQPGDPGPMPDAGPSPVAKGDPHPSAYRTGATRCAAAETQELDCPVAGFPYQDADFQDDTHPLKTTPSGDVEDPATGLTWQAHDDGKTYDAAGAAAACAAPWRLPSVVELATIVDYGTNNPAMDPLFAGAQSTNYWTSTPAGDQQWTVRFDYGEVIPSNKSSELPVRCVQGTMPTVPGHVRQAGAFVANGAVVDDETSGLEWQRADDGVHRSWGDALTYCAGLSIDGKTGWHLPNVSELRGLVEYGGVADGGPAFGAVLDPAFEGRPDAYWTSTPNDGAPGLSLSVSFNLGVIDGVNTNGLARVRCVRHLRGGNGGCGCNANEGSPFALLAYVGFVAMLLFRRRSSGRRGARAPR